MGKTASDHTWNTTIRQHPERAVPERAEEYLAQGYVAHVGFQQDGRPYVIPMLYHYATDRPDRLYLHGGASSRTLKHLASGQSAPRLPNSTVSSIHAMPSITRPTIAA